MTEDDDFYYELKKHRYRIAALQFETRAIRLGLLLKAGFRPDQPRVPRGHPDGGQWTDELVIFVGGRGRRGSGPMRVGNRWLNITPAQQARLAVSRNAMRKALRDVAEIDPTWRPRPQLYETVEGQIQANEAIRMQAELRFLELTGRPIRVGPFAGKWLDSPPLNRRLTRRQREELDRIGRKYGCHGCGSKDPWTPSGSFVGDHQVPRALGKPTRIYPHCLTCSNMQGGRIRHYKFRNRK